MLVLGALLSAAPASAQWAVQRPPASLYSLTDVHFLNASQGFASASIGGFMKTADGGQTWQDLPTGVQSSLRDVFFVTPDTGYVVGNAGVIIRTTNGGQSWQRRDLLNTGASVNGVYAHSGNRVLVTQGDRIFASTNGGSAWSPIYTYNGPLSIFTFRFLEFASPQVGYAVGGYSGSFGNVAQVVKTTDGGQTWQLLPSLSGSAPMGGAAAVAFPTPQTGYVADVQDRLFRSSDGGQTWSIVAHRTFGSFYSMHFTDALNGHGVGYDGNLRSTSDGGGTWTNQSLNSVDTYAAVYFPTPQVGYAVGSDAGARARVVKYNSPVSGTATGSQPAIRVYPNPASGLVKLAGLPTGQETRASLFSTDGRQVLSTRLAPGQADLRTTGLAAGLYLLQLESGGRSCQQKLAVE
ncbi:hypothetical protein GCM10023185_32280 [Hymenobacter saemangeumensis]|uniref:T9SS type A sorting domain-containing protein n=1 Tax=Hymenobacter saemangeumensis TaxID=1084522 RepID=A0ABP8INB8_9BACT